jgi:hypothetical protein
MPVTLEEHIATVLKSAGGVALDDEHCSEVATGEIWRQRANSNDSVQLPRVLEECGRGIWALISCGWRRALVTIKVFLRITVYNYAFHNSTPRTNSIDQCMLGHRIPHDMLINDLQWDSCALVGLKSRIAMHNDHVVVPGFCPMVGIRCRIPTVGFWYYTNSLMSPYSHFLVVILT